MVMAFARQINRVHAIKATLLLPTNVNPIAKRLFHLSNVSFVRCQIVPMAIVY
jgi:hypothetical protein